MKYIAVLIWLCTVSVLHGQILKVIDRETKEPLEAVTVLSPDASVFSFTDEEGNADISELTRFDTIELRLIGYESMQISFDVLPGVNYQVGMQPATFNLSQVVISASRWEQSKKEVPARITSITAKEVGFQNPQTAADLLGTSGEVFIQKSQLGGGSPMIRGFSTNRILIVVDGIRMNNAIFRSGNLQNVISLDPFSIEGTEVFFGPGSVIYGSDAIGGVMSFQTLEPWLSFSENVRTKVNAGLRYATANNEKTGHVDVRLSGRNWGSVTSVTYTDYGDQRMGSRGPAEYLRPFYVDRIAGEDVIVRNPDPEVQVPSGYHQTNLLQKLRYTPGKKWDIEYGFHYSFSGDVPRYDRLIRTRDGLPRSAEWYYGPQKWMMNNLHVTHTADSRIYDQTSLRIGYQVFEESRNDRDLSSPFLRSRMENVDALTANLDFQKSLNETDEVFYGLEAVYNKVWSTGRIENINTGAVSGTSSRYPPSDYQSYALYLTYKRQLKPGLVFQGGVRYNRIFLQSTFDRTYFPFPFEEARLNNGALTGTLGLVLEPSPEWLMRASLASGFRAPNVDDVGKVFDSAPGNVVVPNASLKPEYAYNAEVSVTRNLAKGSSIFVNAYYTHLDNALVRRNYQLNGMDSILYDGERSQVQAIQNAAKARVYGIEFGLDYRFGSGLGFSGRFNFQRGREELDDGSMSASRHAPPPFGLLRIDYTRDKFRIEASSDFNFAVPFERLAVSERDKAFIYATNDNGNPYAPGWATFNLRGSYQFGKILQLTLGLENILDKRYRPYSSGIVAPGRNLVVSLKSGF